MPLKHLEHDGAEDYLNRKTKVLNRNEVAKREETFKKKQEKEKDAARKIAQAHWMNPENPALWIGDFE